jgi:hypothetical protein
MVAADRQIEAHAANEAVLVAYTTRVLALFVECALHLRVLALLELGPEPAVFER